MIIAKPQLRMLNVTAGKVENLDFKKIVGFQLIKQWNSFILSANNKIEVIKFIVAK